MGIALSILFAASPILLCATTAAADARLALGNAGNGGPERPLAALADAGTTQAARQIVRAAVENVALRDEAGRLLEGLGDVAVPALIEAKARSNPLETRKWAIAVLEAMNKKVPGEAVQTKDNALLVEVLLAYGKTHDLDAVGVVFAFANTDRTPVREAARAAIGHYGAGALPKLRETYSNLKNAPAPEAMAPVELSRELFRLMDHSRLRDLYALFDGALAQASKGADTPDTPEQLEPAVRELDRVFARVPAFDRRLEAVPIYVRYARSLEDREPAEALATYRRAERLAAEGPDKARISSSIAYLEARELLARGIVDREALQRAATLDPGNSKAKAELSRLDAEEQARTRRLRWGITGAAAAVLLLTAALLFVHRGRKTEAPAS